VAGRDAADLKAVSGDDKIQVNILKAEGSEGKTVPVGTDVQPSAFSLNI
jgi:hypothetical protein